LGVCLALSIKVRLFRFHSWLPQAHVQARTEGSIMLAGVLLKLGGFGFLKISLPLFSLSSLNFCRLMLSLGVVGCVFTSLITLKQLDFKRVIAYASIGHMAISISALFSSSLFGLVGGVLLLLSHGLVSAGLFFLVGVVYIRLGSRNIKYYGGLLIVMRLFSVFFVLFSLSNISVRGLVTFLAEFLIFIGLMSISFVSSVFAALVIVLGAGYTIWLVSKVLFGQPCNSLLKTTDLTFRECSICLLLFSPVLILGFVPMRLIRLLNSSLYSFVLFKVVIV
jgi:NADH-quinone oxidoreductase subunit M